MTHRYWLVRRHDERVLGEGLAPFDAALDRAERDAARAGRSVLIVNQAGAVMIDMPPTVTTCGALQAVLRGGMLDAVLPGCGLRN
jgi:hypothetical protein